MRVNWFLLFSVIFLSLLLTVDASAQRFKGEPFQKLIRTLDAPLTAWQDENGYNKSLPNYNGEVVLVNFWATWCGPCVIEMPDLDRLQKKYAKAGLKVVAISIDEEGPVKVKEFYKKNKLKHLEIFNDYDGSSAKAFNVRSLPTSFLIGRDGKVIGMVNGFAKWDTPANELIIRNALRQNFKKDDTPFDLPPSFNRQVNELR